MQQKIAKILILGLLACWRITPTVPLSFVVIVNKSNQLESLSAAKIRVIYLRKISRWPWGAEIQPVDLPERTPIRIAFLKSILNFTTHDLDVYWIDQRVSRALAPPTRAPDVKAAKILVASNPGAVGFIPESEADESVRIIQVR